MKQNKLYKIVYIISIIFICISFAYSKYLLDKDVSPDNAGNAGKPAGDFPPYIAINIKAQIIPNIKGAVKITWDTDTSSTEEFIVGRLTEVPNTREKALSATSIKLVPTGSDNKVIDSNLQPGEYYYVVLSKNRIMSRDIEVYPDVNYTSRPVVIEKEMAAKPVRVFPEQVTLIHAQVINKIHVIITWKSTEAPDIVYTVYRSRESLNSPARLKKAEKVGVITDRRESYIDRSIVNSGTYYYAVTTTDIAGNEDLELIPEQSYLVSGIYIAFKSQLTVSNLRASRIEKNSVQLSWDGVNSPISEYLIYRYNKPVVDTQRLALATLIGGIKHVNNYTDKDPGPGSYYYAVLVRLEDSTIDNTIKEGSNCLLNPVIIEPSVAGVKPETKETRVTEEKKETRKPEIPVEPEIKEAPKEKVIIKDTSVDLVLRESFFPGRYKTSIKRLQDIVNTSDNEYEIAKARLFIGRSLVEMKQYKKALQYFIIPEVAKHFPKESRFWQEYTISHIK